MTCFRLKMYQMFRVTLNHLKNIETIFGYLKTFSVNLLLIKCIVEEIFKMFRILQSGTLSSCQRLIDYWNVFCLFLIVIAKLYN